MLPPPGCVFVELRVSRGVYVELLRGARALPRVHCGSPALLQVGGGGRGSGGQQVTEGEWATALARAGTAGTVGSHAGSGAFEVVW